jgi:hypothetical protein
MFTFYSVYTNHDLPVGKIVVRFNNHIYTTSDKGIADGVRKNVGNGTISEIPVGEPTPKVKKAKTIRDAIPEGEI